MEISFIIPHKNSPYLLERCLSTIPKSNKFIQIIVVDDNSEISSIEYLKKLALKNKEIEFYFTKEDRGAGFARNYGIKKAKGDWICFIDCDDILLNDSLNIIKNSINKNLNADIVYFKNECIEENTNDISYGESIKLKSIERLISKPKELEKYLKYCCTQPWSKLFKRNFIIDNNISFEETLVANDYRFSVISGLKASKIGYVNTPFYKYIVRKNSLSENQTESYEKIISRLIVYYNIESIFKKHHIKLRPFSLNLNNLLNKTDKKIRTKLLNSLKAHGYISKLYKFNIINSKFLQIPRKVYELLNLPFSGI